MPIDPMLSRAYIGGTITLAGVGTYSLFLLLQQQLDTSCPGRCQEMLIATDSANSNPVYFGPAVNLSGALSPSNYAYVLIAGASRLYRSDAPGCNCPISDISLVTTAASILHVEIIP